MDYKDKEKTDADRLEEFRNLLKTGIVQQLRLVDALKSGVSSSLAGSDLLGLGRRLAAVAPGVLTEVARSSVEAHTEMMKIHAKHFDKIGDTLFGHKPGSACKLSVKAKAEPGNPAIGRFRVRNPYGEKVAVRFTTPKLLSAEQVHLGGQITFTRIRTEPSVDPDEVIEPEKEARFQVQVDVPPNAAVALYSGEFDVVAGGCVVGVATLEVDVCSECVHFVKATAENADVEVTTEDSFAVTNNSEKPAIVMIGGQAVFDDDKGHTFTAPLTLIRDGTGSNVLEKDEVGLFKLKIGLANKRAPGTYRTEICVLLDARQALRLGVNLVIKP